MSSIEDKLSKLREERKAREKARIEKLRQMNLKKYNQYDHQQKSSTYSVSLPKSNSDNSCSTKNNIKVVQNKFHVSDTTKRPISAIHKTSINYATANKNIASAQTKDANVIIHNKRKPNNTPLQEIGIAKDVGHKSKIFTKVIHQKVLKKQPAVNDILNYGESNNQSNVTNFERKSVFDRLYKPKVLPKQTVDKAQKLQTNPNYFKKVVDDSKMIMNRKNKLFESKNVVPVRRSISAVHFKKINKNKLQNSFPKWASIGERLHNVHLQDINEDAHVMEEAVVSAVKTERQRAKVTFQTPSNFNTPRPEELQSRLISWLEKRGKFLESYHHLQCFGLHHLSKGITPVNLDTMKYDTKDDENKENIALEHDSDNDSYNENMNYGNDGAAVNKLDFSVDNWRRASFSDDSVDCNKSLETISGSCESMHHVDELLVGVLNDLTKLLREGFEWEQCARWLRVVRERFPRTLDSAPYWECRAALEECRGDLPASLQCWEQAIAKGTKHSVADTNLDNVLDKFMQLKISPSSGKPQVDPKLVDVKSVFKSTIIRFGIQQAKLRQSSEPVKYTVTPVRRSSRLSMYRHTPLRVCATLQEAAELGPIEFVPNRALNMTP